MNTQDVFLILFSICARGTCFTVCVCVCHCVCVCACTFLCISQNNQWWCYLWTESYRLVSNFYFLLDIK